MPSQWYRTFWRLRQSSALADLGKTARASQRGRGRKYAERMLNPAADHLCTEACRYRGNKHTDNNATQLSHDRTLPVAHILPN